MDSLLSWDSALECCDMSLVHTVKNNTRFTVFTSVLASISIIFPRGGGNACTTSLTASEEGKDLSKIK